MSREQAPPVEPDFENLYEEINYDQINTDEETNTTRCVNTNVAQYGENPSPHDISPTPAPREWPISQPRAKIETSEKVQENSNGKTDNACDKLEFKEGSSDRLHPSPNQLDKSHVYGAKISALNNIGDENNTVEPLQDIVPNPKFSIEPGPQENKAFEPDEEGKALNKEETATEDDGDRAKGGDVGNRSSESSQARVSLPQPPPFTPVPFDFTVSDTDSVYSRPASDYSDG